VLTIAPPPCAFIMGMAFLMVRKTALRPTSMVLSHTESGTSAVRVTACSFSGAGGSPKALLCRKSRRPNCLVASASIASTSASRVTSAPIATALPPLREISRATELAVSSLMSATTTAPPRLANSIAVALPIPEPAPVTTPAFLSNFILVTSLLRADFGQYQTSARAVKPSGLEDAPSPATGAANEQLAAMQTMGIVHPKFDSPRNHAKPAPVIRSRRRVAFQLALQCGDPRDQFLAASDWIALMRGACREPAR